MKNIKKQKIYYIISIIAVVLAIVGFTFAYFEGSITNNAQIDIELGFEGGYIFKTQHETDVVNLTIDPLAMFQGENDKLAGESIQKIRVSLENLDGKDRYCTYDVVWLWDSGYDHYTKTSGATYEFTLDGIQLPNYKTSQTVLFSSNIVANGSYQNAKVHELPIRFYNLSTKDQSAHAGKNYQGIVKIANVECQEAELKNLSETVIALESDTDYTSSQNSTPYRVIDQEAKIPDTSATYTKLTQSQYGTTSEYKGSSYTSTSGTNSTTELFFDWQSDNTWKNDQANMATSSYYHLKIPVTEEGVYQICYKVTATANMYNSLYAYVTDSSFSASGNQKLAKSLSSTQSTFTCVDLGTLTTSQGIRIVNRTYTSKTAVTFYLQKVPLKSVSTGIRYEGANPDNYVTYNDEEWRIIGTFDGADIGLQSGKKYTKIIRSNPFSKTYPWDWEDTDGDDDAIHDSGEYNGDWTEATLNALLNNDYLNQTGSFVSTATDKGLSPQAREMIAQYNGNYSKWYLGGVGSTYNTDSSDGYYAQERGNAGYGGTTATNKLSINAAIGLMYPSDYGYAMYGGASETTCINTTTKLYSGGYNNCEQYDWLHSYHVAWTITPYLSLSDRAFYVHSTGYVYSHGVYDDFDVRPVLYLESDVVTAFGDGSKNSPYVITQFSEPENLSETVIAHISDSDYTSSQDKSPYRVINQNGVRYEGANPDNYVTYNDEEWRIIGTFDGADIGLEEGKKYTKIIKERFKDVVYPWNDQDGDGALDSADDENDWENSTLKHKLNTDYLNQAGDFTSSATNKGLSAVARDMIAQHNGNYSTWYLKGTSSYSGRKTDTMYDIERNSGTSGYRDGESGAASATTQAAIGLMYPSDYGYAMYGGANETLCLNTTTYLHDYDECEQYNWLYTPNASVWLLSPGSGVRQYALNIYNGGEIMTHTVAYSRSIQPTLYLEADIVVATGDGSKINPYVLDTPLYTLSDTVIALADGSDRTSITNGSVYRVIDQNGIRYEGANPDNYVTYNDEEWRIIGVFNGADIGLESGKKYTKIIRSDSLSSLYAWADNGVNDWTNASLNSYLNGEYLNDISSVDKNMIAKFNGNYSSWSLRGVVATSTLPYPSEYYYIMERDGRGYGGTTDVDKLSVNNAIGLMYPSDYGYALYDGDTDLTCDNMNSILSSNYSGCKQYNWLYLNNKYQWTIMPEASLTMESYCTLNDGNVNLCMINQSHTIRPTLYLSSDVAVPLGNGSQASPYKLK